MLVLFVVPMFTCLTLEVGNLCPHAPPPGAAGAKPTPAGLLRAAVLEAALANKKESVSSPPLPAKAEVFVPWAPGDWGGGGGGGAFAEVHPMDCYTESFAPGLAVLREKYRPCI